MNNGSQPPSEPSFVSLLGAIANDAKDLLLQETADYEPSNHFKDKRTARAVDKEAPRNQQLRKNFVMKNLNKRKREV